MAALWMSDFSPPWRWSLDSKVITSGSRMDGMKLRTASGTHFYLESATNWLSTARFTKAATQSAN